MKWIGSITLIILASCAPSAQPVDTTIEAFLDGTEIRELLVGSCMTGNLADGRPYQRSWTEAELEEAHTGHNNPLNWHYYRGTWSVSETGIYTRTILPWTRHYMIGRNGETIVWVEVDENGNKLANTYHGAIGDGCSRL